MKRNTIIEDANFDDLRFIALNLRPEDRLELAVTRDADDYESLAWSAAYSRHRKVAITDGRPVFAFGAADMPGQHKVQVWGFGTRDALPALKPVTRYIQRILIPEILSRGVLSAQAISHPANKISHRWLKHLGFTLGAAVPDVGDRKETMFLFTVSAHVFHRDAIAA